MSFLRRHSRIAVVALSCVALGAGASAIASAGAATGSTARAAHAHGRHHGLRGRGLRWARRAVHADLVVPTKQGFVNVTVDRGVVDSVSGNQLILTEGTKQQTYKTVTLAIPSAAKVRDDKQPASLSSLRRGQRVIVVQAPQRTFVVAHTQR
ncbi:MAG: hypothetical protein M3022_04650 [Actinomycetota bacterium]|nr:hypothetical protein [Actinomycetota bacterium]